MPTFEDVSIEVTTKIDVEFEESIEEVEQGDMINFSGEFALVLV